MAIAVLATPFAVRALPKFTKDEVSCINKQKEKKASAIECAAACTPTACPKMTGAEYKICSDRILEGCYADGPISTGLTRPPYSPIPKPPASATQVK